MLYRTQTTAFTSKRCNFLQETQQTWHKSKIILNFLRARYTSACIFVISALVRTNMNLGGRIYLIKQTQHIHRLNYKLKPCSKKEFCKQCRHVNFKGTMTKWFVQKQTHRTKQKHAEHQDATGIQTKILLFVFLDFICLFFTYNFLSVFFKKC